MSSTKRRYEHYLLNSEQPCPECGQPVSQATAGRTCDTCGTPICVSCTQDMEAHERDMCSTCEDNLIYERDE